MSSSNPVATRRNTIYRGVDQAQRVAERRASLIDAAIRLFGTQGYHGTTVRGICAEAQLSERYFYESFTNTEDLLLTAYHQVVDVQFARLEAAIAAAEPAPAAMIRAALTSFLADARQDPAMARLTLIELQTVSAKAEAAYRAVQKRIGHLIERVINTPAPRAPKPGLSSDLLAASIAAAFNGLALFWAESEFERPLDEIIRNCLAVFEAISGLWTEPGAPRKRLK